MKVVGNVDYKESFKVLAYDWMDRVAAVAPGRYNPAAVMVVLRLVENSDVATLERLEAAGLRGGQLWGVLKDECGGDFEKLAALSIEQLQAYRERGAV